MANIRVLQEWFDRVDSEKTGSITTVQLQSALAVGNLQFPITIVQQMIRMYDFDRNGTMSFGEFVALNNFLLKVRTSLRSTPAIRKRIFTMTFEVIHATFQLEVVFDSKIRQETCLTTTTFDFQVQQAFSDLERGHGFLVPSQVYEALLKIGISLDSPAFYTVCESFDKEKDGRFRLDDLMSLCIFVQSARNLFNSFDTSKQGKVTLDLNQFIYCTANCRI